MGGVEEMLQKSQLSPGIVCVLYMFICVHMCEPDVVALSSCISISFYEFVFNLLTSVLQQRAVNQIYFML